MSIHVQPADAQVAEKALLSGEPLRAKYIAEHFLGNLRCYNQVRVMYGFTGSYHGKQISIQGTGMGMPSMEIYATELMKDFGVKTAIRVGTCGVPQEGINIKDVVIATAASTDSNMNHDCFGSISFAPAADFTLVGKAAAKAAQCGIAAHTGTVYTSDKFYENRNDEKLRLMHNYGVLEVDMETCELYTLAAKYAVSALTIMTVSDSFVTYERCSAEESQNAFNDAFRSKFPFGSGLGQMEKTKNYPHKKF